MRFSAWSLRVISASSGALLLAPVASAHLSVSPTRVQTGALVDLTFGAPNADDPMGIDHVTVRIPAEFVLDDGEAKAGWSQSRTSDAITWTGGNIPKGEYATFSLRGTAPRKAGVVTFDVLVGDRAGRSITYRVGLDVTKDASRDNGARTLGKAAIAVALVAALVALAALFVGLYVWLRPPPRRGE